MDLKTPLVIKRTTFLSTEGCTLPFYEVLDSECELVICTESERDKDNFAELIRRANAFDGLVSAAKAFRNRIYAVALTQPKMTRKLYEEFNEVYGQLTDALRVAEGEA